EDVYRELVVELPAGNAVTGRRDPNREVRVQQAEVGIRPRGRRLDAAEPVGDGGRDRLTRDGEVVDGLGRLAAPELLPFRGVAHAASLAAVRKGRSQRPMPVKAQPRTCRV